jgi:hypothetical protein
MRLARPRSSKIICSPSYVDFTSRANTTRGLDFDHMMRRDESTQGRYEARQETKIAFDVLNAKELMQKL